MSIGGGAGFGKGVGVRGVLGCAFARCYNRLMAATGVIEFRPATGAAAPCRLEHQVTVGGQLFRAHSNGAESSLGAIAITVEHSAENGFTVEEPVTGTFGIGETVEEAFEDFAAALVEYRTVLSAEESISGRLAEHLNYLNGILGN